MLTPGSWRLVGLAWVGPAPGSRTMSCTDGPAGAGGFGAAWPGGFGAAWTGAAGGPAGGSAAATGAWDCGGRMAGGTVWGRRTAGGAPCGRGAGGPAAARPRRGA